MRRRQFDKICKERKLVRAICEHAIGPASAYETARTLGASRAQLGRILDGEIVGGPSGRKPRGYTAGEIDALLDEEFITKGLPEYLREIARAFEDKRLVEQIRDRLSV